MNASPTEKETPAARPSSWIKLIILAGFVGVAALLYFKFGDSLSLTNLADKETELRTYQSKYPVAIFGIAFLIYVSVTGFSLPGAAALTLIFGWYFGFVRGTLMVSFASTLGATLAFFMSRYLLRDTIQNRFGESLKKFNAALEKEGAFYLFTLRLIPAVPFFVINLVMGLTPLRTSTYWWISQLGMLPGTMAFVYAGSSVPDLKTLAESGYKGIVSPQLIIAFVILGLLPITLKKIIDKVKA